MNVHIASEQHVAEEGLFSVSDPTEPVLHYFPVRGRAEPIRLLFALKSIKWYEPPIAPIYNLVHKEPDGYPFRQLPRLIDEVNGTIDIVQSMAILRHLGRKFGLYGGSIDDAARIDMLIEAFQDVRAQLRSVWGANDTLDEAECSQYVESVMATGDQLKVSDMQGPGVACFERILERRHQFGSYVVTGAGDTGSSVCSEGSRTVPWFVGCEMSIADLAIFDLVDLHLQVPQFADAMQRFPKLMVHHAAVAAQPGIAAYLQSSDRHELIWLPQWLKLRHSSFPSG